MSKKSLLLLLLLLLLKVICELAEADTTKQTGTKSQKLRESVKLLRCEGKVDRLATGTRKKERTKEKKKKKEAKREKKKGWEEGVKGRRSKARSVYVVQVIELLVNYESNEKRQMREEKKDEEESESE